MLQQIAWSRKETDSKSIDKALKSYREQLVKQQQLIQKEKLPVLVLIEGWGAAGKGSCIGKLIRDIDPRFFHVVSTKKPSEEEERKPFLWRHFINIPENGKFLFLDSGWMDETIKDRQHGKFTESEYANRLKSINIFERQLTDNGYLLVKMFLHISQKEQEKRIDKLRSDKDTAWRVSENDLWQNSHYDICQDYFDAYLTATDKPYAPWHIINGTEKKEALLAVYQVLTKAIDDALAAKAAQISKPFEGEKFEVLPIPLLSEVSLDKTISEEKYQKELKSCQKKLRNLHNMLYRRKIPLVIAYEGWDAAGKGGNIKRITSALDPRGFEVIPIASPAPYEKARHYLWRFWNRLPKTGHIVIFDRTWYGRVMVERIEGFCSEDDWKRAYTEINEFEKELTDWGAVVLKFWVQIDKDTQLARFTDRQNTPEKQWKITDEDWRNRDKWDQYETAVNEMLQKTNTKNAPWHIIESVDKKYARIQTLHYVIDAAEKALHKAEK